MLDGFVRDIAKPRPHQLSALGTHTAALLACCAIFSTAFDARAPPPRPKPRPLSRRATQMLCCTRATRV